MSVLFSFEKRKSFKVPFEELLLICKKALDSLGLEVSHLEQSSGIIQARKPSTWPFKSKEVVSVTVGRDSKVVVIAKIDMGKADTSEALIVDKFFDAVNQSIQEHVDNL
jgi:uncharacterized membrane protein YvbJ